MASTVKKFGHHWSDLLPSLTVRDPAASFLKLPLLSEYQEVCKVERSFCCANNLMTIWMSAIWLPKKLPLYFVNDNLWLFLYPLCVCNQAGFVCASVVKVWFEVIASCKTSSTNLTFATGGGCYPSKLLLRDPSLKACLRKPDYTTLWMIEYFWKLKNHLTRA